MSTGYPTAEETELIRESVLLPMLLDIAQKNIDELNTLTMTFKPYLIKSIEVVMDRINKRLTEVKKDLKQRNIKAWEHQHRGDLIDYKYVARGYSGDFTMWKEHARSVLRDMLNGFMRDVFRGL